MAVGYPHCTLYISEIRGRVKAWFDAQGRVQTYRGRVYMKVLNVCDYYCGDIFVSCFSKQQKNVKLSRYVCRDSESNVYMSSPY